MEPAASRTATAGQSARLVACATSSESLQLAVGLFCKPGDPKVDSRGDGRRVGERARPSVVRRTQESPTRGRRARAGLTDGQIVKEGTRDLNDQG
jgi:hypothetical protein